jgi:hypothetical protein
MLRWACYEQGQSLVSSNLFKRFELDMAQLFRMLRSMPAFILWRSYAPSHFGGKSGAFVQGQKLQASQKTFTFSWHQAVFVIKGAFTVPIYEGSWHGSNSMVSICFGRRSVTRRKKGRRGMTSGLRNI